MPPVVPRKRLRSPDPDDKPSPQKKRAVQQNKLPKTTLFNAIDAPQSAKPSAADSHRFLDKIGGDDDSDSASISESASDVDSDEFEDVQRPKQQDAEQDDDLEWEDALGAGETHPTAAPEREDDIQDVSISVKVDGTYIEPLVSVTSKKKGPSKRERLVRTVTHTLHVQSLMWHNTVRNTWLNDTEVQRTLVSALTPGMKDEITIWKRDMGMLTVAELRQEKAMAARRAKMKTKKNSKQRDTKVRDWSYSADHAEAGTVNMSHGDPLLRLLRSLAAYWKKRFVIMAPGIRKRGYMPLRKLREHLTVWENDKDDERCGERVRGLKHFRQLAKTCEGSRDVGAQLFVALLRGLGLQVRMVANLQPVGFGFSKTEEAVAVKASKAVDGTHTADDSDAVKKSAKKLPNPKLREVLTPKQSKKIVKQEKPSRSSARGNQSTPITLDDTDSSLTEPPSSDEDEDNMDAASVSEASVVDVTPLSKARPKKKYDRDLQKPVYWAEVLSTLSNDWIPVDAVVMRTVANNELLLQDFEPRGSQADRGKQVICYTIAFAADGTAKDVTVRYLKKHQLPGKTKGVRMPIEKIPIYNRKGKVKKYEEHDWFQELMLRYAKPEKQRTAADEKEDAGVLKPSKPSIEKKELENESLAWYKASADYVLAEHLRREEALVPGAKLLKTFTTGKGEKAKEYRVYNREEVVTVRTVESWHKEGRGLLPGEQPIKYVPIRAVTLQRKREIEDAQRETGEKPQQGMYSINQTDWIIPDPIVDGIIPTNAYGNMDVFAPTMVPAGAIHLPLKGSAKLCRRLQINYAEACTGFEFGKQRAVPVITGVVVARENATIVRQAWRDEQAEIKRKEDVKRTAAALHWWRKMLLGMRVIDRMKADYEHTSDKQDEYNPFVRKTQSSAQGVLKAKPTAEAQGGGFLLSEDEDVANVSLAREHSGLQEAEPHEHFAMEDGGGFLPVDGVDAEEAHPITPVSLQSLQGDAVAGGAKPLKVPKSGKRVDSLTASDKKQQKNGVPDSLSLSSDTDGNTTTTRIRAPKDNKNKTPRPKATPTRSPYFSSQEMKPTPQSGSESEGATSDGEVVVVRRTTARTRVGK